MSLQYELRHARHAIGEFTATLTFASSILQPQFDPIARVAASIAERLHLPAPMPSAGFLRLQVSAAGTAPPAGPTGFQRYAPDGTPASVLICDDDTIQFSLREYDRWHSVAPTLLDIFTNLAAVYLPMAGAIKSMKIQYLNEFRAKSFDVTSSAELFQPQSKWIAPFALETNEFWHCHIGQFVPINETQRNLINVNCDIIEGQFPGEEQARRIVKVLVLAGCFYDVHGKPGLSLSGEALAHRMEHDLNEAHALERRTLAEVISDDYLEPMGALNDDY